MSSIRKESEKGTTESVLGKQKEKGAGSPLGEDRRSLCLSHMHAYTHFHRNTYTSGYDEVLKIPTIIRVGSY